MEIATYQTFHLATAFAARFASGKYPYVFMQFRFGELTMFAGNGRNAAYVKLAVPPTCYCDVGLPVECADPLAAVATLQPVAPVALVAQPDGSVRIGATVNLQPVVHPDTSWMATVPPARPAMPDWLKRFDAGSWGAACVGLNGLSRFPTMGNPIEIEPGQGSETLPDESGRHILRPAFSLADGIIEAWALLERV